LLELTFTVTPVEGAFAERFSVKFCVPAPLIVRLCGENVTVAVTSTGALEEP
jgi:hypothetical protein